MRQSHKKGRTFDVRRAVLQWCSDTKRGGQAMNGCNGRMFQWAAERAGVWAVMQVLFLVPPISVKLGLSFPGSRH